MKLQGFDSIRHPRGTPLCRCATCLRFSAPIPTAHRALGYHAAVPTGPRSHQALFELPCRRSATPAQSAAQAAPPPPAKTAPQRSLHPQSPAEARSPETSTAHRETAPEKQTPSAKSAHYAAPSFAYRLLLSQMLFQNHASQTRTSSCCRGPVTQALPGEVSMFTSLRTPNWLAELAGR